MLMKTTPEGDAEMKKNIYLVQCGEVYQIEPVQAETMNCNWENEAICISECEEGAHYLASQYDKGRIGYDTHTVDGYKFAALS